ncbi:MAG: hypothetical protein AAFV62_00160 [Pseudomonadota bacterium]
MSHLRHRLWRGALRPSLLLSVAVTAALSGAAQGYAQGQGNVQDTRATKPAPVLVRGGEHGRFSRLALEFKPDVSWQQSSLDKGLVLTFDTPDLAFNAKRTLRRQLAHRLESVQTLWEDGKTKLILQFNCVCSGRAYEFGSEKILIDVRDGAPKQQAPAAEASAPQKGDERKSTDTDTAAGTERDSVAAPLETADAGQAKNTPNAEVPTAKAVETPANETGPEMSSSVKSEEPTAARGTAEEAATEMTESAAEKAATKVAATKTASPTKSAVSSEERPKTDDDSTQGEALAALRAGVAETAEEVTAEEEPKSEIELAREILLRQLQRAADEGFISFVEGGEAERGVAALEPLGDATGDATDEMLRSEEESPETDRAETRTSGADTSGADTAEAAAAEAADPSPTSSAEASTKGEPADAVRERDAPGTSAAHRDVAARATDAEPSTVKQNQSAADAPMAGDESFGLPEPLPAAQRSVFALGETPEVQEEAKQQPAAKEAKAVAEQAATEAQAKTDRPAARDVASVQQASARDTQSSTAAAEGSGANRSQTKRTQTKDAQTKRSETTQEMPRAADVCIADDLLDLGIWPNATSYNRDLGVLRNRTIGPDGAINADAVEELSAFYLFHGLGLEAAHTPVSYGIETERAGMLRAMAKVLEGQRLPEDHPMMAQIACPGHHGVWQAAALADTDAKRALAALEAGEGVLPVMSHALRRAIGARVGLAAVRAGEPSLAKPIMQLLERNGDEPTLDMHRLTAELALDDGALGKARYALSHVMESRDPRAVLATIRYGETLRFPEEVEDASKIADRLASYAFQYRAVPLGEQAALAEARLRGRFGDLRSALAVLDQQEEQTPDHGAEIDAVRSEVFEEAIADKIHEFEPNRAIPLIETFDLVGTNPLYDQHRIRLAQKLLDHDMATLVELALPNDVARRSHRAATLRVRAERAAALGPQSKAETGEKKDENADVSAEEASKAATPIETADVDPSNAKAPKKKAVPLDNEAARLQAMSRYLSGETELPPGLRAALEADESERARSLLALFDAARKPAPEDKPVAGARSVVEALDQEIDLLKEIATDG